MLTKIKTRSDDKFKIGKLLIKIILPILVILGAIYLILKIDMPSPNKPIKQEISTDKLINVK
ncbi:MAG: hypothetical protein CBC24_03925 [Candidatus Pelagibacter sp. TMED64]|nr:hypothetical protein [Candidatus Pelagibacter sp.]OUU66241.1 MAG: hypothetical protein CBC24_03925 [Candidatus Pelagibacter sp. TMED64]